MLDIAPIPEKVLYINEPWLIDISFDGMEKVSEEPDPNPDNVRVYLPLDLNAEAILRRLRYVIYRYGEANEANESDLCDRGTVLLSHVCDKRTVPLSHPPSQVTPWNSFLERGAYQGKHLMVQ